MKKRKLFDADGTLYTTDLLNGSPINLLRMDNSKYKWATALYKQMKEVFWIPQTISMSDDLTDWAKLPREEKTAYKSILSFLVFLDSIQVTNIPRLADYFTAPEVCQCLTAHAFQEAIHADSYSYLIESLFRSESEKLEIYEQWKVNNHLKNRIKYITGIYQDFSDNPNKKNFIKALIGNYILEGIYFYNAFNFFFSLENRGLMRKTASMIRFINRDELLHRSLFQRILENIDLDTKVVHSLFSEAVDQEITWSNDVLGDEILGISKRTISEYTKFLANECLLRIKQPLLYPKNENPYKHLESLADTKGEGSVYISFFENTSTSYQQESVLAGWDF